MLRTKRFAEITFETVGCEFVGILFAGELEKDTYNTGNTLHIYIYICSIHYIFIILI